MRMLLRLSSDSSAGAFSEGLQQNFRWNGIISSRVFRADEGKTEMDGVLLKLITA